MLDSVAIIGVW